MQTKQIETSATNHSFNPLRDITFNIRSKIIMPYLVLTFIIALVGIYVITRLVAGSLTERLNNHLLESGRAVLNNVAAREIEHIQTAQLVGALRGVAEALQTNDTTELENLAAPAAKTLNVDTIILVNAEGEALLQMVQQDGELTTVDYAFESENVWIIKSLLDEADPNARPRRGVGFYPADERYYYFTALPLALNEKLSGVIVIGSMLDSLLPDLKSTSLADVVIYAADGSGRVIADTFTLVLPEEEKAATLAELAITAEKHKEVMQQDSTTLAKDVNLLGRNYRMALGTLIVAESKLTTFGVVLPANFIVDTTALNRNLYAFVFTLAMGAVILVGYVIAQRITTPINKLVRVSQAVAEGDLHQRTQIHSRDEVGQLATTFDQMTSRLEERTEALKTSLQIQKETASRMRAILSSIGDGVILEDGDGNFFPLNAAAETMLEDMAAHFLYGPMRELAVAEQDAPEDDVVNPWLLESRRFQVADKVYSVHSAAVGTDEEEPLGTVIVLRDVTVEVEAEQLKDAFVAHVSHELRTPLTSIKGYSALLLATASSSLSADQKDFLNKIGKQTDNLVAMINALLDFSEVEAGGRLGLRKRRLLFSELVEDVYDEWVSQMETKDLKFSIEIEEDLPMVNADSDRLHWAVINLVRNAWQYTPEGGSVKLRLFSHYDRVTLEVSDTGVGIAPDEQQQLFSRFSRILQDSDDDVRGLGLGLYVTKAIVEAHGGYVQVVSEIDVGSTFSLVLPAVHELETEGPREISN